MYLLCDELYPHHWPWLYFPGARIHIVPRYLWKYQKFPGSPGRLIKFRYDEVCPERLVIDIVSLHNNGGRTHRRSDWPAIISVYRG